MSAHFPRNLAESECGGRLGCAAARREPQNSRGERWGKVGNDDLRIEWLDGEVGHHGAAHTCADHCLNSAVIRAAKHEVGYHPLVGKSLCNEDLATVVGLADQRNS